MITISYGYSAPSLEMQLESQGYTLTDADFMTFKKAEINIFNLGFIGVLTVSQIRKAEERLTKLIAKKAIPLNNNEEM